MTGPTSKFLKLKVIATYKVWTKSNGWNGRSPYLAPPPPPPPPPRTDTICYALYFKLGERVPSWPRRLLVGYHPDHPVEARVPTTRGGLTVGASFRENILFKLKKLWSVSKDFFIIAIDLFTVCLLSAKKITAYQLLLLWSEPVAPPISYPLISRTTGNFNV